MAQVDPDGTVSVSGFGMDLEDFRAAVGREHVRETLIAISSH
jgi:hypothetical protein